MGQPEPPHLPPAPKAPRYPPIHGKSLASDHSVNAPVGSHGATRWGIGLTVTNGGICERSEENRNAKGLERSDGSRDVMSSTIE